MSASPDLSHHTPMMQQYLRVKLGGALLRLESCAF